MAELRSAQDGILIVGAGLAGLSLSLALAKRGIKCTVIEKQKEITPSRWAILVYPQGVKIFDELGVLEETTALGLAMMAPVVEAGGETLLVAESGLLLEPRFNYHLMLGPSEVRKILRERALENGVEIVEGVECKHAVRDARGKITGVRASKRHTKDVEDFEIGCGVLVGAEGYKSKLRGEFGIEATQGFHGSLVVSFFMDDYVHGQDRVRIILGDGRQTIIAPCTSTRLNVGFIERDLTFDRLKQEGGEAYVKRRIKESAPFLSGALEKNSASFDRGDMYHEQPFLVKTMHSVVDGGVLIGDSAHSFHPSTGSGAQQTMIDALTLAPVLEKSARSGDFSFKALEEYERLRRLFLKTVEASSKLVMSVTLANGRFNRWLRYRQMRAINKARHATGIPGNSGGNTLANEPRVICIDGEDSICLGRHPTQD